MSGIRFCVDGEPVPKQSFRVAGKGGYRDPRVTAWQNVVAWQAQQAMQGREMLSGDLRALLVFRLGNRRRVDADNLSKAVLDSLHGIVYPDDCRVVDLHITKIVDRERPGVTVEIEQP